MTDRATVFEDTIIGLETTRGVSVPVTKRLSSLGFSISPEIETRRFRPQGRKLDTLVIPGRSSSTADIEGAGTFHDIVYALSSILGKTTPVLVATTTAVWDWTFNILPSAPDNPATYTVESGSSVRAAKFTHGMFTDLTLDMNTEEVTVSGTMMGQGYTDGVAKTTAGVTSTGDTPIIPDDIDVFLDSTFATLATTQLLRVMGVNLEIGSRFSPVWTMNSQIDSWAAYVETAPDLAITLNVEADTAGMALLPHLRTGATRWIAIKTAGPIIEGTSKYELDIRGPVKVEAINSLGDSDGVYAAEWGLRAIDTTDISGVRIRVRTNFSTL